MSDADTIAAVTVRLKGLPPDPDGINESRAGSAQNALDAFWATGWSDDDEFLVSDLITNLMHWCDRNSRDFDTNLTRARGSYDQETTA